MHQLEAYQQATLQTSDDVRIVSLLFDGALNFLRLARIRMEERDVSGKGLLLGKATAVVSELAASLNVEEGGEIARNLRRLYDFVLDRLLQANLRNDPVALGDAEKILEVLQGAWKEMERNHAAARTAPARAVGGAGMAVRV